MLSADSLTDSQKGRIDERPADSKAAGMDDGSRVPASRKRDGATVLQEDAEGQQQEAEVCHSFSAHCSCMVQMPLQVMGTTQPCTRCEQTLF